jgi:hydrogenase maturation protease
MQTECLVAGSPRTRLQVKVRFLHLVDRQVGELLLRELVERSAALRLPPAQPAVRMVESLQVDDQLYQAWQEAVERTVCLEAAELGELAAGSWQRPFGWPGQCLREPLCSATGEVVGLLVRQQQAVEGAVELCAEHVAEGLFKARVRVENRTPLEGADRCSRDEALLRTLVSTHTLLGVEQGEFVSLLDPPAAWRDIAAGCRNEGAWPVLVGEDGARDTMLSSPIILYDYPQIAPESPGDFFDATEIDEMLTLRILTMTDDEKRAMAAVDKRARALLHRTEALSRERFQGMHGTLRQFRPLPAEGET